MSTVNQTKEIRNSQVNIQAGANNTPAKSSVEIEIGKHVNEHQDLCDSLGITEEQLNKILANPEYSNFLNMGIAEQLQVCNNVLCLPMPEQEDEPENKTAEKLKNEAAQFNYAEFDKLPEEKQLKIYSELLVKNEYAFHNNEEEYSKLSSIERQELVKEKYIELAKDPKFDKSSLTKKMFFLQVANSKGILCRDFRPDELYSSSTQKAFKDYLSKYDNNSEMLSGNIKVQIKIQKLMSDAFTEFVSEKGNIDTKINNIRTIAEKQEVNPKLVLEKYLLKKENKDTFETELLEQIKQSQEALSKIDTQEVFRQNAIERSENPALKDKYNHGRMLKFKSTKYYKNYEKADNAREKVNALMSYIKKQPDNKEASVIQEIIDELSLDPNNYELTVALHRRIIEEKSGKYLENVLMQGEKSDAGRFINRVNIGYLPDNKLGKNTIKKFVERDELDMKSKDPSIRERAKDYRIILIQNTRDDQVETAQGYGSASKEVQMETFERIKRIKSADNQRAAMKYSTEASEEVQNVMTANVNSLQDGVAEEALERFLNESPYKESNTRVAVDEQVVLKAPEYRQCAMHNITQTAIENNFSGEEAVVLSNALTDQIQYCAQTNQQTMYERAMQSQNTESVKYAQQAYETRYTPQVSDKQSPDTTNQNYTAVEQPVNQNVSNPTYERADFSNEATKSAFEQFVSGEVSIAQASDSFNKLTESEKQEVLKALPKSDILKMSVSVCELCPEFIPEFVDAHRGLEVKKAVKSSSNTVIACMKKKMFSDHKIFEQMKYIAATEPWALSKATQEEIGMDNNKTQPDKPIKYIG